MLQMEPLGDRILIKPDEEKNVSIKQALNPSPVEEIVWLARPATTACILPNSLALALKT
jgi:hypothetical protein